jgi:hypothetical protein
METDHAGQPIRAKLRIAGRTRDLALFNLAIDSKLRGCDVVAIRVDDVVRHPAHKHKSSENHAIRAIDRIAAPSKF